MRYPPDQKQRTRQAILDAASRVFRRQGYQGGGVDAVMKEAGLTHGGFYSHFPNKEALLADTVLESMLAMREQHHRRWTEGLDGDDWLQAFLNGYLSREHRARSEQGCVVPPLVSEVARSGEGPRGAFEKGVATWAGDLSEHLGSLPESQREQAALSIISACVGALAVSRAVADPDLSDRILHAARDMVERAYLPEAPADAGERSRSAHTETHSREVMRSSS